MESAVAPPIPALLLAPFVTLLTLIALGPLWFSGWWGRHYSKVAGFNAIATELEQLDRQQRASMPQHVIDMLGQRIALTAR